MDEPDDFGVPRLFVARLDAHSFAWELRRFGGVLLQRSEASFDSFEAAQAAGQIALAELCAAPEQPTYKRQNLEARHRLVEQQSR